MSRFGRFIGRMFGNKAPTAKRSRRLRGAYDAAQETTENQDRWTNADSLSAVAAHDRGVRAILRERSRYETQNNSYLGGLIETLATDLVGTGPRPQIVIPGPDRNLARQQARRIEQAWSAWSRAASFGAKLWLMDLTRRRDGECFGLLINNPGLRHAVKLDLRLYESEQVDDPSEYGLDPLNIEGIRLDEWGNPIRYRFLRYHPGGRISYYLDYHDYGPEYVVHWFRPRRPGQVRGVPETTAALPLCSQLRRYILASLSAAEFGAVISGVMETDLPAADGNEVEVTAMTEVPLTRATLLTTPAGWHAKFSELPTPVGLGEFKKELLNEVGRGMHAPLNIVTGNSSGYNFSSGRLDHLPYQREVKIERSDMRGRVLDPFFREWVDEASLSGTIDAGLPPFEMWGVSWYWDGFESIEPDRDARTNTEELDNGTTTLTAIFASKGLDFEEVCEVQAREQEVLKGKGLPSPYGAKAAAAAAPATPPTEQPVEEVANA